MGDDYIEKDFDDEVYEDDYYEEHYNEEELKDLDEFSDEEDDFDEEDEDEDNEGKKRRRERKVHISYACEDCDYRWDDIIIKKKDEFEDDIEKDVVCPMCGSINITLI